MRIGIFGGTFDPPHNGHLALAKACLEHLELDEVIFLPANRNPLKTRREQSIGKHRLALVKALIADEPKMAVSDMELTRGGISYTVDTLGELHMVRPAEYWFLMGADSLKGLSEWRNPQRLFRLCRIAVVIRPPVTELDAMARVPEEFRDRVDIVPMPALDLSSTQIRERIARNLPISAYVPKGVQEYITKHDLYKV